MIRAGLVLYDRLGKRRGRAFPFSRRMRLRDHVAGVALKPEFDTGFVYSDAWCDDSRLVVLTALDAQQNGATILTRTRCTQANRIDGTWSVQLRSTDGLERRVAARALVNATGPWAASFLDGIAHVPRARTLRLVKGSHIVVPRLFDHVYAYTFQQADRRIVFAIPFERDYTLIGTTDIEFKGDVAALAIDAEEIDYLCAAVNRYFKQSITSADVVWSYAGVRPLLEEDGVAASEVTRDYLLDCDKDDAPLLNVFGGKITTHRKLAEEALDLLAPALGSKRGAWTAEPQFHLPGGEFADGDDNPFDAFLHETVRRYPWLGAGQALRYARSYGTRLERIVGSASSLADLGERFGADLYAAEVDYLVREEWAQTSDDILWRRSKLGLRFGPEETQRLEARLLAIRSTR